MEPLVPANDWRYYDPLPLGGASRMKPRGLQGDAAATGGALPFPPPECGSTQPPACSTRAVKDQPFQGPSRSRHLSTRPTRAVKPPSPSTAQPESREPAPMPWLGRGRRWSAWGSHPDVMMKIRYRTTQL
ncbi:hypothetical protein B0T26DRAFT_684282 [Lasiosphaeria miniovina]|uniref:Uncharacterized protein n=1 Tax=Lasiosphaeria miniovina TaxID=1954250 RepID=A0AA40BFS9_9PEZI|nr:uncharacterized protein B0T26DRAFT_684282 [Lasiosphaeria miniovina]KAK0733440.1 hypothetical protein B0T26DRAFT_684282 [Lasiosphaeria miniovina]